jgi:stage IV sporulation protein FB
MENDRIQPTEQTFYPPKPQPEDKKGNVWLRSLTSLVLYLVVGYYFFQNNWVLLLLLTAIVIFHELGHFIAMKAYNYKDLGIFFIPLLGAYASGTKREVSQKQSVVILLAGPLPGIIVGLLIYFLHDSLNSGSLYYSLDILRWASIFLIVLNVLNLLPIYPLDGGQLLNRLFLDESKLISKIFVVLSAGAMVWLSMWGMGRPFYPLLVFPALMLLRLRTDTKFESLTKEIESRGINLEKTYEEITDEEYWKIRNILIEKEYSTVRSINPAPPYEYSPNEDRVVSTIEGLLQRTIIQDLNWFGKLFTIIIWVAAFASPFLLEFDFPIAFFRG